MRALQQNAQPREKGRSSGDRELECQLDHIVQGAVSRGMNREFLWSVFEVRLARAVKGGDRR